MRASPLKASGLGLSRNEAGRQFPHAADAVSREELRLQIVDAISCGEDSRRWTVYDLDELSPFEVAHLVERGLMTPAFSGASGEGRGFAVYGDGEASLEINGDDHLRLLGYRVGDQLSVLWSLLNLLDDRLETAVSYAFDPQWDYLLSRPTQAGTGLRIYATLHLPALVFAGRLGGIAFDLVTHGLGLIPLWGGAGGVVQVSNLGRQGKPERELLQQIEDISQEVVEKERSVRKLFIRQNPIQVRDHVGRAIGVAQHAWSISFTEAVNVVSAADVGIELGLAEVPGMGTETSFELMRRLQPAHVIMERMEAKPGGLESPEIDEIRAQVLREVFAGAYVRS